MDRKSIKKVILIIFTLLMLLFGVESYAFYTEDTLCVIDYTPEYEEWQKLSDEEKTNTVMPRKYAISSKDNTERTYFFKNSLRSSLLPSRLLITNYDEYDLRQSINIAVRDQGSTGQCWAFSMNSAIESNSEKLTGVDSPLYSARYIEYATSKTFLDGINPNSYNREIGEGGFAEIALGLYTSGRGPVLESDFPFQDNPYKINLSEMDNLTVQKQVKDYVRFPSIYKTYNNGRAIYKDSMGDIYTDTEVKAIRDKIKDHIIKYGAVISQTYGVGGPSRNAKKYYNNPDDLTNATAYFCNNTQLQAEHQITIIGWDDNYSVTNFNENYRPSTPGAYLVLNSWGEEFGDNGTYYISYEDVFIEKDILGIEKVTDIDFNNIYQHDKLGNNDVIASLNDIYGANVFERDQNNSSEWLSQISVASLANIKCDIYVNPSNGNLNASEFVKVASNVEMINGYHTIALQNPIKLTGSKFAVIVKYIASEDGITFVGIECPDKLYWDTATAERGQSYISSNLRNWDDIVEISSSTVIPKKSNLCIKAFTTNNYNPPTDDPPITPPTITPTIAPTSVPTTNPTIIPSATPSTDDKYFRVYQYGEDEQYIYGISPNTKLKDFTNNISTNMEYYVYNSNNQNVGREDIISTGMRLEREGKTYKLVVLGDLSGDGKVTITDVVKIRLHLVSINTLIDEFWKAADVNKNGDVSLTDAVIINLVAVSLRNL